MSSAVCLSVVCLSVTFVRPTQAIEIFGNVSTPYGTLAICWHPGKILRRSSQGNPSVGGVKHKKGVAEYSDFEPIEGYMVPKLVTLNDLERRDGRYIALFHWIW